VDAEQRVVRLRLEDRDRDQVASKGECVEGEAEAVDADAAVGQCLVQRGEWVEAGALLEDHARALPRPRLEPASHPCINVGPRGHTGTRHAEPRQVDSAVRPNAALLSMTYCRRHLAGCLTFSRFATGSLGSYWSDSAAFDCSQRRMPGPLMTSAMPSWIGWSKAVA
jgi:hypothetical protein